MSLEKKRQILAEFSQFITPERREKIERNARLRTRSITVVLEDIYQAHNASAVLRSADCFGVQDVHIIEYKHRFRVHEEIAKGSAQWLSLYHYQEEKENNTAYCFDELRKKGYKIIATTPHENDMLIDALPIDQKVALVFGTEQYGLSKYALEHADGYVKIPMFGFTESFNISVSAAISLYELTKRLRASDVTWKLTEEEIVDLELEWVGISTQLKSKIIERLQNL